MNTLSFESNGQVRVTTPDVSVVLPLNSRAAFSGEGYAVCEFVDAHGKVLLTTNTADFEGGLLNSDIVIPHSAADAVSYITSHFTGGRSFEAILRYPESTVSETIIPLNFGKSYGTIYFTALCLFGNDSAVSTVPFLRYSYAEGENSTSSDVVEITMRWQDTVALATEATPVRVAMPQSQLMQGSAPMFPLAQLGFVAGTGFAAGSGTRIIVTLE